MGTEHSISILVNFGCRPPDDQLIKTSNEIKQAKIRLAKALELITGLTFEVDGQHLPTIQTP